MSSTPWKRTDWNDIIDRVNAITTAPGCPTFPPLPDVDIDHIWTVTDIQAVRDRLLEICPDSVFITELRLWKQEVIDELNAAIASCHCCDPGAEEWKYGGYEIITSGICGFYAGGFGAPLNFTDSLGLWNGSGGWPTVGYGTPLMNYAVPDPGNTTIHSWTVGIEVRLSGIWHGISGGESFSCGVLQGSVPTAKLADGVYTQNPSATGSPWRIWRIVSGVIDGCHTCV